MSLAAMPTLTIMLLTVATYSLRRQMAHNTYVNSDANRQPMNRTSYDYIVVGAGTAGCVLAGRLANNPNVSILLLEAGGPQSVITDMPGNTLNLVGGEFDWNYNVVTQQSAGLAYPNFFISRGKVLGGSSVTNWDIYNRGNPEDYNNWATQYGLTNMSWHSVREYFLLFENNTDQSVRTGSGGGYHNYGGPVSVSTETQPDQVLLNFQRTMNQAGYTTLDINGPSQLGTTIAQMFWNADTGIKSSTANSYIESANRSNLVILSRATVQNVLVSDDNRRTTGVRYTKNGQSLVAYANQEVILSAGPINTPQVLILSGIGPANHLAELNIPLVRHLPVGENLHDMVFVPLYYRINDPAQIMPYPEFDVTNLYNYYQNSSGPLAHHADGVTYYRTSNNQNQTWPDTMVISVVEFFDNLNATVGQYANNSDQWRRYWEPYAELGYYLAIDPVLARPISRGYVRLNVSNPTGPPLVDPRYLEEQDDFDAMLEVTRFAISSIQQHPMPNVTNFPTIPGCLPCAFYCEEYLRCYVRQLARSYYNFVGTARMGLTSDPNAVVDPNFRVLGFDNLRVVDASVIPEIPNAHTNAATIMLAEKAARLIMTGQ